MYFGEKQAFKNNYLISPFTLFTSINLNKNFRPAEDPYKYQINALVTAINLNLDPNITFDMLKFATFMEMFSYCKYLKMFRPPVRVQYFIENPAYTPLHKKKRA